MNSTVSGLIGETSVLSGTVHLQVAAGHAINDLCVGMTACKILPASLSTKADKNVMNRHEYPTDL